MISDVDIRQPRHHGRDAALASRVTESQLATGIRTARVLFVPAVIQTQREWFIYKKRRCFCISIQRFSFSRTSVSLQVIGPVHVSRASDLTQKFPTKLAQW